MLSMCAARRDPRNEAEAIAVLLRPRMEMSFRTRWTPSPGCVCGGLMASPLLSAAPPSRWRARPRIARGAGRTRVRPREASLLGQSANEQQRGLVTVRTGQPQPRRPSGRRGFDRGPRSQQELESLQRRAVRRMKQAIGTDAVKSLAGDVLEEATQELMSRKGHGLAPMVSTVAVTEGHRAIVEGGDGLIGDRRLVHVTAEVLEDVLRGLDDGLGEDDPGLVQFFTNNNPPADEVKLLNKAPPYTP